MRCFRATATLSPAANQLLFARRHHSVGTNSSILPPTEAKAPEFGTTRRRRHRQVEREIRDKAVIEEVARAHKQPSQESEEDAETICRARYNFLDKPLYMRYWTPFLAELKRLEFRWMLTPGVGAVYHLDVVEHEAATGREVTLCKLRGNGNMCLPLADIFDGLCGLLNGDFLSFSAQFFSPDRKQYLVFEAVPRIESNVDTSRVQPAQNVFGRDVPQFFAQTSRTGYCVNLSLMENDVKTPLFHELSIMTICYAHLTSVPTFLHRTDIGIRNYDFLPPDQLKTFRFVWCFLRRECRMTPVEIGELDLLIPPR